MPVRLFLFALGAVLAVLIGASQVLANAHSVSEVVLGCALGLSASLVTLKFVSTKIGVRTSTVVLTFIFHALCATIALPNVDTHALVTRIALFLGARNQTFDRNVWLRGGSHD